MSDFHQFTLDAPVTQSVAASLLRECFPDFQWRKGDSDSQGPYVSGRSDDGVRMKLWLGEEPPVLTISFDSFAQDAADRDKLCAERLVAITEAFSIKIAPLSELNKPTGRAAAE